MGVTEAVDGTPLIPSEPAIPCGVAAKYFFNDVYTIYDAGTN